MEPRNAHGNEKLRIWLGFAIISFVWGSTWLAIKIGLESIPPFLGAGVRFAVATAILLAIVRVRQVHVPFTADAKKVYLVLGFLSFGAGYGLVYWGEQFISSGLCSVLFAAFPFCVAIFSHFILENERLSAFKIGGIAFGMFGLLVIFWSDLSLSGSTGTLGMAAVLMSVVLQSLTLVLIKRYGQAVNPFSMNLMGMGLAMIVLLTIGFVSERGQPVVWSAAAAGSVLYLAAVGSVLAFVTYYWLLKRVETVYLSLTTFINPIVAVILGAIVLGESFAPQTALGASLVLAGLLVANGKQLLSKLRSARQVA
jgi:drug/metabolite transporter (DMT)-like permease